MRRLLLGAGCSVGLAYAATAHHFSAHCAAHPDAVLLPDSSRLPHNQRPHTGLELDRLIQAFGCTKYTAVDFDCLAAAVAAHGSGQFFGDTLPFIVDHACDAPGVRGGQGLPALGRGAEVKLTARECASLLSAALLCMYPGRTTTSNQGFSEENPEWPSINFDGLLRSHTKPQRKPSLVKVTKLRMLLAYFDAIRNDDGLDKRQLHLQRRSSAAVPVDGLAKSKARLTPLRLYTSEDSPIDANGMLRLVTAANGFVGSGALTRGQTQGDLLFLAAPELLIGRLLCRRLEADELLLMRGAQQFSRVFRQGHDWAFGAAGRPIDGVLHPLHVACVPAPSSVARATSCAPDAVRRDLQQVVAAVSDPAVPAQVAITHWETTEPFLNLLVQWAGCSHARKEVHYFPPEVAMEGKLLTFTQQMQQKGVTVGQLVQFLTSGLDPEKPIVRQACDHFQLPQV